MSRHFEIAVRVDRWRETERGRGGAGLTEGTFEVHRFAPVDVRASSRDSRSSVYRGGDIGRRSDPGSVPGPFPVAGRYREIGISHIFDAHILGRSVSESPG